MSRLLKPVLSRWEVNPPAIHAQEAYGDLREAFGALRDLASLRPMTPAGAANCTECSRRCRVEFIADKSGSVHGFIHCGDCGIAEVPARMLERWEIDTGALLATMFRGIQLSVQERVAGHLWQVGKATWASRSREVWFARCFRRDAAPAVVRVLERRPKAILFAPTEMGAARWQEITPNLTLALETTVSFTGNRLAFDAAYVESRIVDASPEADSATTRRTKKRADRAANIEALRKEMIAHLLTARDYAFATKEQTGEPELLPRPTQKALGERVGLSESDVSRCLKDQEARELRLYWETAIDLHQIMAWKRPIARGRKT